MNDNLNRDPAAVNTITKKPGLTADGTTPSIAITKLDVMPIVRQNQDLINWRNYTRNAEARVPRRALLYSLYFDVMLDGHVISVTSKRVDAITTAAWQYVDKSGKPVDVINELVDSIGFSDLLTEIINSRFWGYSMVDCYIYKDDEGRQQMTAEQFDRRHMRPETGSVSIRQSGDEGFSIREGLYAHTVLECGKEKDLGLFLSAAQYAILKRGGVSDWATFVEVFGQPIIDAQWDGFDEQQRLQLLDSIKEMGNNGVIVHPAGTTIQFVPNQNNANGQLQNSFMDFLNKEISKALLGSTETTEASKSSGYAQSKTHAEQDDKKNESDLHFVRRVLNSRFIKILKAFGLPYEGGQFIVQEDTTTIAPVDEMAIFVQMAVQLGMPIDHDYIYEKTGMPKPADYDQQIAEKKAAAALETQQMGENESEGNAPTPDASGGKGGKKPKDKGAKPDSVKLKGGAKLVLQLADFFGWPRT